MKVFDPESVSLQDEISFDNVKRHGPTAVQAFLSLINNGQSVKMAEICVTRKAPSSGITDHTYQANKRGSLIDQFHGCRRTMEHWQAEYKKITGESLPTDAVVMRSLATRVGDPDAVLSHKHSLADIQRKAKARNIKVEGDWEQEPVATPPRPQLIRMGEDLIEKYVDESIKHEPDLVKEDRRDLREMVVEKHSRVITAEDLTPEGTTSFKDLAKKLYGSDGSKSRKKSRKTVAT